MEGQRLTLTVLSRNHHAKHALGGHGVAASIPIREEVAGAIPSALIERDGMAIVLTSERCFKFCELDALGLFRILLCFGNLPDHA